MSKILSWLRHSEQFTLFHRRKTTISTKDHIDPKASDLVETKEVGVTCMIKISGVWYIHKNSVVFLELQGGGEVTLWGPGVWQLLGAETSSVGLHQGQGCSASCPPHKHRVDKEGCRGTVLQHELHSGVDVVDSSLVDSQSTIFKLVDNSPGYVRTFYLQIPAQRLGDFLRVFTFNTPCKRRHILSLLPCRRENHIV